MTVPQHTLTLLRRLARSNGATIDATVAAVAASWLAAWTDVSPAWQAAITAIVDQYQRTGAWPPAWQVARIEAIAVAEQRTQQALSGLIDAASTVTSAAVADIAAATVRAEPGIIASQRPGLQATSPSPRAVDATTRARQTRVALLHRPLAGASLNTLRQALTRRPAGPGPVHALLTDRVRAAFDTGLVRSSTIARTEPVDAYRDVSQLVQDTNRSLVSRWAWHCSCDRRSCPACWVMHGQQFPLDVAGPAGHPSCRCTRLPLTAGVDLPSAETRFRRLPRRQQIAILGPGRWELLRTGQVSWVDLVEQRPNPGWRHSYTPRPVAALRHRAALSAA